MSARVRTVHVPYTLEQDEDGVWCASAQLRLGVGAVGDGETREAALDDLREALQALIAEVGIPDELTLTLNVALCPPRSRRFVVHKSSKHLNGPDSRSRGSAAAIT